MGVTNNFISKRVADIAKTVAGELNIHLFEGVYGATSGPAYETPSEVVSFTKLGTVSLSRLSRYSNRDFIYFSETFIISTENL